MHEVGLMQDALGICFDAARRGNAKRISRIAMRIGELSGAEPEALRFAFEAMSQGTIAEHASIEFERTRVGRRCLGCGADFDGRSEADPCPQCGAKNSIRTGFEIQVASIDVD
jgi:hydrogenase nickel incorporation protein HypA/HybF